jgi:hypothetical protein
MAQWLRLRQRVSTRIVVDKTWFSRPNFPGTKIAAGNLLLSFGILFEGTSATKVFRIPRHRRMTCVSLTTFFKYQRVSLKGMLFYITIWWIKETPRTLQ